ncbi:MAG TPA: GNAT family N-acetyltransferase [Firmicutes bacterium]|nr:GNAT family N-acetyltransferase [Bacillota bacterium]
MSIIKAHNITLYGGNDQYKIVLRPLSDEDLPYLYQWNADPEVLYWAEGDDIQSYPPEIIHKIYGGAPQDILYFAIEVNGQVIGECWLQKMNLSNVKAMYTDDTDVRRIDMMIGEKSYWGKGIGTLFIRMLVDFAFTVEKVDVLHCFCEDYNIRSRRVWEKNGFSLILTEDIPQPSKGRLQYHWRLTKSEYEAAGNSCEPG